MKNQGVLLFCFFFFFFASLFLMIEEQYIHSRKCGNSRKSTEEKGTNLELLATFPVFLQTALGLQGSGQHSSRKLVKTSPLVSGGWIKPTWTWWAVSRVGGRPSLLVSRSCLLGLSSCFDSFSRPQVHQGEPMGRQAPNEKIRPFALKSWATFLLYKLQKK